ncbi:Os01g0908001 [Oryza sativa Japonica Group]|uniref:Os01g0908001 protein n=1 Tax=Oryza sativa subsp. japonica TaxID=39947 RepID=A0A0P0VBT2_ORYSJ|nr:hypothetical protein EE612_007469 [Oryza sativa]BAS75805.1 Os01g0908001 [Oryza sativa Japonica Group]
MTQLKWVAMGPHTTTPCNLKGHTATEPKAAAVAGRCVCSSPAMHVVRTTSPCSRGTGKCVHVLPHAHQHLCMRVCGEAADAKRRLASYSSRSCVCSSSVCTVLLLLAG